MDKSNWMRILLEDGSPFLEAVGGEWTGPDGRWVQDSFDIDMESLWEDENSDVAKAMKLTESTDLAFTVMVYGMSYRAEECESYDYGIEYDGFMEWENVEISPVD